MAEYVSASNEQMQFAPDNASMAEAPHDIAGPVAAGFFSSQPKVLIGFALLLVIVLAKVFGSKEKLPPGVKRLPRLPGLPYAGRFWDVPAPGIEAAWHFGGLHKKMGPIYEWKVRNRRIQMLFK